MTSDQINALVDKYLDGVRESGEDERAMRDHIIEAERESQVEGYSVGIDGAVEALLTNGPLQGSGRSGWTLARQWDHIGEGVHTISALVSRPAPRSDHRLSGGARAMARRVHIERHFSADVLH